MEKHPDGGESWIMIGAGNEGVARTISLAAGRGRGILQGHFGRADGLSVLRRPAREVKKLTGIR